MYAVLRETQLTTGVSDGGLVQFLFVAGKYMFFKIFHAFSFTI